MIIGNAVSAEQMNQEKLSLQYAIFNTTLEYTYTGKEITPEVNVAYCGTTLNKDVDYTLEYENNTDVGMGKIIINGIGNYCGEKSILFCIKPLDINRATISGVTNKTFSEGIVYYTQDISVTKEKTLVENVDYKISYQNNTGIGTAYIIVDGIGNYCGRQVKEFSIVKNVNTTSIRIDYVNRGATNTAILGDKVQFFIGDFYEEGLVTSLYVKNPSGTTVHTSGVSRIPLNGSWSGSLGYFTPTTTGTYTITYVIRGYTLVVSGGIYVAEAKSYGGTTYTQTLKVTASNLQSGSVTDVKIKPMISSWYDTIQLAAEVKVSRSNTNSSLTWKSSNTDIATVDGCGKVKFSKPGTTVISVATYEGKSDSLEITISPLNIATAIKDVCIIADKRGYDISFIGEFGELNTKDYIAQLENKGEYVDVIASGCGMYSGEYRCSVVLPKTSDIVKQNGNVTITVAPNVYKGAAHIFLTSHQKSGSLDDVFAIYTPDLSLGYSDTLTFKNTADVTYKMLLWGKNLVPIKEGITVFSSETEEEKAERLNKETIKVMKSYAMKNCYSSPVIYKSKFYVDNFVGQIWYIEGSDAYTLSLSESESQYSYIINMRIENSQFTPTFTFYAYNSSVQYNGVVNVDVANYKDGDSLTNVNWNFSDSKPNAEEERLIMQGVSKYHARLIYMLETFLNSYGKTIRNIGYTSYFK